MPEQEAFQADPKDVKGQKNPQAAAGTELLADLKLADYMAAAKSSATAGSGTKTVDTSLSVHAKHLWQTLGLKDNEGLTQARLDKAFRDNKKWTDLSMEDAAVVVLLRNNFKSFKEWQDPKDTKTPEIKLSSLTRFDRLQQDARVEDRLMHSMQNRVDELYQKFDGNGDDRLSKKEIGKGLSTLQQSLNSRTLSAQARSVLADQQTVMKRLESEFPDIRNKVEDGGDGISVPDMQKYVSDWRTAPSGQYGLARSVDWTLREATSIASTELYANTGDPLKSIRPEAVVQGIMTDCYFEAAVASLAEINPQAIKDMIVPNADGTYTVTFPYASNEPITVNAPSAQELFTYSHASEHGTWPAVLEKAYGAWAQKSYSRRNWLLWNPAEIEQDNIAGPSITHGLKMITGGAKQRVFAHLDDPSDAAKMDRQLKDIDAELVSAFKQKRPVTLYTGLDNLADAELPKTHHLSVLKYDAKSKMVTLRNPWGYFEPMDKWSSAKDGKNDGTFQMPLNDAIKRFMGIAIATK